MACESSVKSKAKTITAVCDSLLVGDIEAAAAVARSGC